MDEQTNNIIYLIKESALDQTIKDILIRDLQSEGLTDFLKEQIKSYCLEGIKKIDAKIDAAKKTLEEKAQQNPPA
jgi:hypothetical protein